jgi:putative phage-type endonuclease
MKVDLEQGTDEWHEWRFSGLGASDAAAIMGVSPWKTAYQLFLEKTGKVSTSSPPSYAMKRGTDMEEEARQWFNFEHSTEFVPECHQSDDIPFLKVSLDGIYGKDILEIKCPGKKDHQIALDGCIPEKYIPQLQMQMMVTGARYCYYLSYDGERGAVIKVDPDLEYQKTLKYSLVQFWNDTNSGMQPPLTSRDYLLIDDDEILENLCHSFKFWKREQTRVSSELEFCKQRIIDRSDDGNFQGYGIKAKRCSKAPKIDYRAVINHLCETYNIADDDVEEAFGVNTNVFHGIGYWKITTTTQET